jgi:hypothetical protein
MTYHNRLSHESRRAQDHAPDDGFGLLKCGMAIIGVVVLVGLIWRVLG